MRRSANLLRTLIAILILLLIPLHAAAQGGPISRVEINHVAADGWPEVAVYATAADATGSRLAPADVAIQVFEDGREVTSGLNIGSDRTGLAAVILLDLSGSMAEAGMAGGTRFDDARAAALDFVNMQLTDGDLVGVIGFASTIEPNNRLELTTDRSQAANLIGSMAPETDPNRFNTALWDATFAAAQMFEKHPDAATRDRIKRMRRAVIAFTDGTDTASGTTRPGDLVLWAMRWQVSYHTVGLKSPSGTRLRYKAPDDTDARWLAAQTFGSFFDYGDDTQRDALPGFLERLAGQRDQLRIAYSSRAKEGAHVTRVIVAAGAASQEAEVNWNGGGRSLEAAIVEPAAGTSFRCSAEGAPSTIRLEVTNPDGRPHTIDRVEFYANDSALGAIAAPPYAVEWDADSAAAGEYTLSAILHDVTLDEIVVARPVVVRVEPPGKPEVQLVSPAAGAAVTRKEGAQLMLESTVAFPDGCDRKVQVAFKADGVLLPGSEKGAPPYRHQWDISKLAPGTHQISVEAADAGGGTVAAGPVSIEIKLPFPQNVLDWAIENWYVLALALALLLLLVLLLRTRRQIGRAVGQAVVRVRQTFIGNPSEALATLQAVRGPAQGRSFTLSGRINTVGRDLQQCEVIISDDGRLSARHFRIDLSESGPITVTDLGSTNGTAVDGQRLPPNQPVALHGGERIRAGENEFELHVPRGRETRVIQRR